MSVKVKCVKYLMPSDLLGKSIHIYLKGGDEFNFKVCEAHLKWGSDEESEGAISGVDTQGQEMKIYFSDIDFIIGGNL